jgi:hypothetical protein
VDGALRMFGVARVVRYHENRGAPPVQVSQQLDDSLAVSGIQVSRRLVSQQN